LGSRGIDDPCGYVEVFHWLSAWAVYASDMSRELDLSWELIEREYYERISQQVAACDDEVVAEGSRQGDFKEIPEWGRIWEAIWWSLRDVQTAPDLVLA
jgi:hypothetical protein